MNNRMHTYRFYFHKFMQSLEFDCRCLADALSECQLFIAQTGLGARGRDVGAVDILEDGRRIA